MEVYIAEIRSMVEDGLHMNSEFLQLQSSCYGVRGFLGRFGTVRMFCSVHSIHYHSNLSVQELDRVIHNGVITVGHSYSRCTMHGLLASNGVS